MLKFGFPLVYVALRRAARADTMVCTIDAGVTHCEAPLRHYRGTGTREGNRTYFEDNKGRRWMMIEEEGGPPIFPFVEAALARWVSSARYALDINAEGCALAGGRATPRPSGSQGAGPPAALVLMPGPCLHDRALPNAERLTCCCCNQH